MRSGNLKQIYSLLKPQWAKPVTTTTAVARDLARNGIFWELDLKSPFWWESTTFCTVNSYTASQLKNTNQGALESWGGARSNAPWLVIYKWVEQYDVTAQSRSTAAICMVLQVGKMVLLTAARGMHEFFQIWDLLYRSEPQQTELIKSNSQKSPLLGTDSCTVDTRTSTRSSNVWQCNYWW